MDEARDVDAAVPSSGPESTTPSPTDRTTFNGIADAKRKSRRRLSQPERQDCGARPERGHGPALRGFMLRHYGALLASTLVLACGGSNPPPPPGHTSPIDPQTAAALEAGLGQAAAAVAATSSQEALAAQAAILALQGQVQAADVSVTASLLAGSPERAALTSGGARAFGFQLQVLHLPGSTGPETFSGILLFQGSDWVLAAGPSPGSPIPPAVGLLDVAGQIWGATVGTGSAQLQSEGAACGVSLPAIVTSCKTATFSNAGFGITSSTPVTSGASGSKTASLASGALAAGVSLVIDCNLGNLCPGSSGGGVQVSVSPSSVSLPEGGTQNFSATVSGTSDAAVVWSVDESAGGTIDAASGRYLAPLNSGTFHVRATSHADSTKSGVATVTVTPPASTCSVTQVPDQSKCHMTLTGAVSSAFPCNLGFFTYDQGTDTSSILNIAGHNGPGVFLASIDLRFNGAPDAGTLPGPRTLIPANGGPGPNNVTIILNDNTTYYMSYAPPDGGMTVTLDTADVALYPDGGPSNLWCVHGTVTADVPNLSPGPPKHIQLVTPF